MATDSNGFESMFGPEPGDNFDMPELVIEPTKLRLLMWLIEQGEDCHWQGCAVDTFPSVEHIINIPSEEDEFRDVTLHQIAGYMTDQEKLPSSKKDENYLKGQGKLKKSLQAEVIAQGLGKAWFDLIAVHIDGEGLSSCHPNQPAVWRYVRDEGPRLKARDYPNIQN